MFAKQAKNQALVKKGKLNRTPLVKKILRLIVDLYIRFLIAKRREEVAPWATIIPRAAVNPHTVDVNKGTITNLI